MTFIHNLDPVLLSLGPLEIRYYGLNYALSFLLGIILVYYVAQFKKIKFSWDDASDLAIYFFGGIVLGARLFYSLAYNTSHYLSNPLQLFAVWNGGMSYHGGLIGCAIGCYLYCRKKKLDFNTFGDLAAIPASIGLFLGRLTNFINGEIPGRVTDVSWGVNFQNEMVDGMLVFRHPSQLYESAAYLVIVGILVWGLYKKLPSGSLGALHVALFGTFRAALEVFRAPDPQIGFIFGIFTLGQLFSLTAACIGWYYLYTIIHKNKRGHTS